MSIRKLEMRNLEGDKKGGGSMLWQRGGNLMAKSKAKKTAHSGYRAQRLSQP